MHKKRKQLFNYLRENKVDIALLQETHSDINKIPAWEQEARVKGAWAHGTTNARGAALICLNNNITINGEVCDPQGRYVMANIEFQQENFTLCNIYGPNKDDPSFYIDVFETVDSFQNANVIIGGDFNLVLNPELDRTRGSLTTNYQQKSRGVVTEYINTNELCDLWRNRNRIYVV